ncbi:polyketide synthase 3 [Aspergillus steynii IBT 23096]|uniref:Polyketide synthase 3 n=1 Tax=Aspergillus steynii IBT 23096 TaxID=1392250 RepID=A0A2I2FV67_9EURO|nr:polyketide synthase 3 [Aspergillus steynii IBT 23096]PLB44497.1 polyketide synthase 3 [Aspergillus steynii IBT 23096]
MYEPIAIVGTACRLPGASSSPSKLWDLLKAPRDVLKEFPPERMNTKGFYNENGDMRGRSLVRHKSYLLEEDVRHFDNAFFDMNPKDAADMDPQQRILLETVYEAFESAGWSLSDVDGSQTSVHVGVMTDDYLLIQGRDPDTLGGHAATGVSRSILANRLSYAFNLQGASLALDTACSSSLVALHLAVQGLHRGEATQAVVAGINLLLDSTWYIMGSSMHMISPESRCRMWDKDASGYARGEGCGAVVLKTLSQAIRDNDHIECIIRGTGVNSDGQGNSSGITIPSPAAQTALIQQTYRDAGLDPVKDRCQYFECHGTGTQAGDPAEAEAIQDAFCDENGEMSENTLFCGSIKTVIGHLEGCAGIAGVIKASLAIQNKAIPPNMHFSTLNPKIEPFYGGLQIPTSLLPWPETGGAPRRASVNSFGFGGTNAHAILESYEPPSTTVSLATPTAGLADDSTCWSDSVEGRLAGPFLFSARSQGSLVDWLKHLLNYLRVNGSMDLDSLSNTLNSKRSVFRYRAAIPAAVDREDLIEKLEDQVNILSTSSDGPLRPSPGSATAEGVSILGVFTGQGAQAARMGFALLEHCKSFRESIMDCEAALASIPNPPTWSLSEELAADTTESHVAEAKFSQPLCTAIQIALVDFLRACGIRFHTVVGHSSGEIGAAYAAGLLTKRDAMGISYYRGYVSNLARGDAGQQGAMLAASMSFDEATAICSEPHFKGRITVAASNAPSSVTLSGDKDATSEMKEYLDEKQIQARALQVDTAYHSHHMRACAEPYLLHLKELRVTVQTPSVDQECRWYSSVRQNTDILDEPLDSELEAQYWVDNLTHPVLFSQAVTLAVHENKAGFSAAIEVGPHGTLRGPVNQTLKQLSSASTSMLYTACLSRGTNAIKTFSEALATIWSLAPSFVQLSGWRTAFGLDVHKPLIKDLPPYAWDHTQTHWRESRVARNYRLDTHPPHDLLGRLWNDSGSEQKWRNTLRLNEMPWLREHVFQNQILFPATGYISLAVDAAKVFAKDQSIKFVELRDMTIPRALPIGEGDEVEILFTIRRRVLPDQVDTESVIEAEFTCYSYPDNQLEADKNCEGLLTIHLGEPEPTDLAPTYISDTGLSTILSTAERSMHSPYLPVGVKRAVIDPNQNFNTDVAIEAYMTSPTVGLGPRIETDINIKRSSNGTDVCEIQLEGVAFKAISEPQPSEDRNILAKTVWAHDAAYGLLPAELIDNVQADSSAYTPEEYERVALFYLRRLSDSISAQEMDTLQPHHQKLIRSINALGAGIREDNDRAFLQAEWLNDTSELILDLLNRHPGDADMALLTSSTERTQSLLKGRSGVDGLSSSLYQQTSSGASCSQAIAQLMVQISHTFPRTNILHMCGDSAKTVTDILDAINDAYASYTCADPSDDVVDVLRNKIGLDVAREKRISFEVLNTEPTASREPYDVVIVTDICRARPDLSESVQRLRSLLRPGGFLISMELTGVSLRPMAILGGSEEWWENAGLLVEGPRIKTGEWDNLLSDNGFSGIDSIFHDQPKLGMHGYSVFSTQATDDRVEFLRNPLTSLHMITPTPVIFIGGETSRVSKLIRQGKNLLRGCTPEIQVWSRFDQIDCSRIPPECSVITLQDLDKPLFSSPPSVNELKNLKEVLGNAQNLLWVTSGRLLDDPYANIMIGIGRSLRHEHIHLNLQFLDFDQGEPWDVQTLMTQFLRLIFSTSSPGVTEGMLWVQEPEIVIRDSQMITPRVLLDHTSNEVYNAGRRRVVKSVEPTEPIEVIHETAGAPSESMLACSRSIDTPEGYLQMEVKLSVPLHANDEAPCYLSYGRVKDGGDEPAALALSAIDSSVVTIHKDFDFKSRAVQEYDPATLVNVASFLIASNLVSDMPISGTTLVCGASDELAKVISALAAEASRKTTFVTITKTPREGRNPGWIYLHPQTPTRAVRKLMPHDATALFDLSRDGAACVLPCLPPGCTAQILDASSLSQQSVEDAVKNYETHNDVLDCKPLPTVFSLSDLSRKRVDKSERLSVVTDWNRERPVNAIIRGLEPQTLISPNKTYFLVGMASELGQSLSNFLVRGGARYIVLSSRNPKNNQNWLRDLRSVGVDIRVVKMDVTDRAQVHETVKKLRQTMPEIGGVTNAALVLEPAVFANLSAASIAKQMMPKIHGTAHLDEVFKNDPLDFFMCFGSLGTVFGNPGHAIYHAGNAYMMSLVANRKRRGLVGSILNFGMLVDVGYVARADRSAGSNVEEWLRTDGLIALSEADFHHVILQGISAGRLDSPTCEVIMGVDTFYDKGQIPRPRWINTPFLSHMVRRVSEAVEDDAPSSGSHQSRLDSAATVEEAIPPITELLSQKIKSMIHVSLDSIHPDEPLSRLGIDSINAIEIRKWLWERLRVEISMVKILGRDASASIIRTVAEQYLAKKPEVPDSTPNGNTAVGADESQPPKTQANGQLAKVTPEVTLDDQVRSTTIGRTHSTADSKESPTSSEMTPGSSPISTPTPEPELEFIRSERLSIAQAGLFYIYKFSDTRTALNLTTRWRIDGPLDVEKLSRAFQRTINRHDSLRTCFFATSDHSEVQQHVTSTKPFHLTRLQSTAETADADVRKAFERIKEHEYSLETGDTLQVTLVRHDAQSHTLVLGLHQLVIDVVSVSLILSDISREYQSQPWSQYPAPTSYLDYTREQFDDSQSGRFKDSIHYWINHLDPIPEALPLLPVAKVRTRQSNRAYGHHTSERELSSKFVQSVTRIGQAHGVTPMQIYLAAMQVFLCRLLNIDDLVIGVLHTGRDPISKFRETVGHLASILPVRFKGTLDRTFPEVVKNTRSTLLNSLDHANPPFALIVDKVRPGVSEGNMPLIQVAYNYTVDDSLPSTLGGCTIAVEQAHHTTVYDFVLDVRRSASGGHVLGITCTDDFYSLSATQFITEACVGVLEGLVREPLTAVKDCRLFSDTQLEQARTVARTPAIPHSWPDSLSERFIQVAAEFPSSVAIKDGSEAITYSQLKSKLEHYAGILLDANATSGTRIAVFCKPSIDLYATMLAVFRIGAIFVPLDVSIPAARRNDILKACKPHALVFHAATADQVAESHTDLGSAFRLLNITELARSHRQDYRTIPEQAPSKRGSDSHILFTSGSTGVPKGIRLHQRGIMNYAVVSSKRYDFGQIRVLQQTSIGFDVSFSQIYSAFTNGGTLVVAPFESRGDPDMLSRLILDEKVQFTMCTPSEYSLLLAYAPDRLRQCTEWRFAGAGGEVLPQRLVDGLRELKLPHLMLTNWYGPTEITVGTSRDIPIHDGANPIHDPRNDKIGSVIGHVVPNNAVYITSEDDGSLLAPGMPGEICVAGTMVANGYLDPRLDDGVFVANPFTTAQDVEHEFTTMYKTGDRGLIQEDGSIVFLGRTKRGSTVIKLRGLRIDLNEVTGAILEAAPDDLADAAVTVRGEPQFLVCHVAFKPGRHLEHRQLMDLLQTLPLPRYMIPATIVALDRLPLVPNGKLDLELLQSLPLPALAASSGQTPIQPLTQNGEKLTPIEERLRRLWIDIIGVVAGTADIGLHSSFLAVGGNSFLLVHLQHAINREIGVKVPLPQLGQAEDLRDMAALIERERN